MTEFHLKAMTKSEARAAVRWFRWLVALHQHIWVWYGKRERKRQHRIELDSLRHDREAMDPWGTQAYYECHKPSG